ncbi:MAG: hypothetical protein AAF647_10145 [Pseudomonadota bacterium]
MRNPYRPFDKRLSYIERKHRKLDRGKVVMMRPDGLMVVQPRRFGFFRLVKFWLLAVILFVGFKAVTHEVIGPIDYENRLARLAGGTQAEVLLSRAMEIDPLTRWTIDNGGPLLNSAKRWYAENRTELKLWDTNG